MHRFPRTVSDYLHDHAPAGHLIGYWQDARREFNVLILHRPDAAYRFSIATFPEIIGHWGHQLVGGDYDTTGIALQLRDGLWGADAPTKARLGRLLDCLKSGLDVEGIIAELRAEFDPEGHFCPQNPPEPRRGPSLTTTEQFRLVAELVANLGSPDAELAADSASKLAAMGINENDGPLFARDALLKFRRGRA